ncbi:uncharacterized protein LOC132556822 [Ylistrum balloti]|uniref:uncharacterized protein LOC132556822 n=1 Tax=Ylistrum balloti TaxID=509963 RepID=UPI0029058E97|nr:uncharacterized protein LOC132556822 [Ylistrum balloti]
MPLSRKRYTVKDKIDIVHWFRGNGSNYSATQREFGVDRKLIRTWNHDYDKLLMNSGGKTGSLKKIGAATPPRSMELDNAVFEWFVEERAEGRAVTNYMLQAQGRIIASQLRVDGFIASNGWLRRWKKRFSVGIRRGTNDAQKLPSDYQEKIAAFHDAIRHLRQANDYTAYNITNMDQTMVRFDTPFTTTNSMIGEKTVRITNSGGAKKGCTEKSGELSSRIQASLRIPPNVRVSASQNGWMTAAEVQRWIRRVWGPNTDDVRRLLTLDSYRPHTCPSTLEIFKQYDTDIVTIPGGVVFKITNYFGNQGIQVGDCNTMQIAEMLSGKKGTTREDVHIDNLLCGALNSILNPKRSKSPHPMNLNVLETKFIETFGDHLPEGKRTFTSTAGMSLQSFLQKHGDYYETHFTSKGKTMVQQRLSTSESEEIPSDNSHTHACNSRKQAMRLEKENGGALQKENIVYDPLNDKNRNTEEISQIDNDADGWQTVYSKGHKKMIKATKQSVKPESERKQQKYADQGHCFIKHLLEKKSSHDLKFVPSDTIYFQNYLLFTIDIISMWNTPKEVPSYIVLGIFDNGTDGLESYTTTGMKTSHTTEHFKKIFLYDCVAGSIPEFSYTELFLGNDVVGVIEICNTGTSPSPCVMNCNRENIAIATREGDMWIRKNSTTIVCKPTDHIFAQVYRWFAESHANTSNNVQGFVNEKCSIRETENKDSNPIVYSRQPSAVSETDDGLKVCISMDQMLDAVNNFRKGHFILLAGDISSQSKNIDAIACVRWLAVFDFDPYSRDRGLLCSNEEPLSKTTSLHITTWKSINKPISEYGTNWCFIRGSRDDPESRECFQESDDLQSWSRKIKPFIDPYLNDIQDFVADYTVLTSIVLWPEDERMLPYILKMINKLDENIDPPPKLVVVLESEPRTEAGKRLFRMFCDEQNENVTFVRMKLSDVLDGLSHALKQNDNTHEVRFDLPVTEQRDVCVLERDASWLREHLNVLFKSSPFVQREHDMEFLQEESDSFYRGGTLHWRTWYSCEAGHFDIERDIYRNAKTVIQTNIQKEKSGLVTLCHAPGAGGTTLAQRLAWEFHEKIPTVHVRNNSFSLLDIVPRIEFIYSKTRKPVLVLIDGEDEQKVFHLMQYLKRSCITIILFVKRRLCKPQVSKDDTEQLWLSGIVSTKEAKQLTLKLSVHCKDDERKKRNLSRLCKETEQGKRHHLINFGLTVFLHEFRGISSFVQGYLPVSGHVESPTADQNILLFLAIAYFYGHTSLPCQFFSELLHLPANYCIDLDDFPQSVQSFVVEDEGEGKKSNIRICHNLVAKEILDHVLSRGRNPKDSIQLGLSEPARHKLASICLEFIRYASRREKRGSISSNTVVHCLRQIFVVRDTLDMNQGSEHLTRKTLISKVLMDIRSSPPLYSERLEVLKKLVQAFPDDPSFIAHLGRFYANCLPHEEKETEKCFLKSLELCEANTRGTSDGKINDRTRLPMMYIYHMYGMFLLKLIKRETGNGTFGAVTGSSESEKASRNIDELLTLVKQACSLFEKSRMYTPVEQESGYGYTGEIEARLHFCDFLQKEESFLRSTFEITREKVNIFVRKSIPIIDQLINECTKESPRQKEIGYFINKYTRWYDHLFKGKVFTLEQMEDCCDIDSCRLGIALTKINHKSGTRSSVNIMDDIKNKEDIENIVKLYEKVFELVDVCDTYREQKVLETNLIDWLRAIRHKEMTTEYSIEHVLGLVAKIYNIVSSPVVKFYIFVLKSLLGFGICSESRQVDTSVLYDAKQLKTDLKACGNDVMKSRYPREWIGNSGNGIKLLIPGFQCTSLMPEHRLTRHFPLLYVFKGSVCHPNKKRLAGFISLDLGENTCPVEVFFIPDIANMTGSQHAGRRVEFTLAFSIENGYEAFNVTSLKKYKCIHFPCGASVEITSAEEFGVCYACKRAVYRNDFLEEDK